MARIRGGDQVAAAWVFRRFTPRLIALARSHLDPSMSGKVDPEDVVQSVYKNFFSRCVKGSFAFDNCDGLWGLLSVMTVRKCADKADYHRAACRDARLEVGLPTDREGREALPARARGPTPGEAAMLAELVEQVLRGLGGRDRQVVLLHLEGYTLDEIGTQVGCAHRTVRRAIELARKRLLRLRSEEQEVG
jgi:RNA polymerase sigma-70 factor (ECF subfamily)